MTRAADSAPRWPALLALVLIALLALIVHERLQPSPVRPLDAPAREFSAARAERTLERLLGDGRPHPTGSAAQAGVRARLLAELELLGLTPSVSSGVGCTEGACAELHDILAEVPGSAEPAQLLIAAHYDSVASGPGAGDDGQGVATLLELARALRHAPLRQGVWLLFTDGEELGLLGARLFAQQHPLARQLKFAINLEARGNRGPSLMFETGPNSAGLIRSFAEAPRPIASSIFAPVYRQLPNDTDFTIFQQLGMGGLNFAFLGGVEHYHTPLDTSAQLDWRSVQHQGESVLASLRAFARGDSGAADTELVYFDLFAAWLVIMPAGVMWPAALLALSLWVVVLARELRAGRLGWQQALGHWGRAGLALAVGLVLPVLATLLLTLVLQLLGALPFSVVATPQPFLLGIWLWVVAALALAQPLLRTSEQRQALWQLTWLCWALLGLVLALVAAEASYLFVLPALLAAALRLWASLRGRAPGVNEMALAALGSALLMMPVLNLLPSTLEFSLPAVLAAVAALAMSPLAPLVGPLAASTGARATLCAAALAAMGSQLLLAPYSAEVPQRLSLVLEVGGAEAHWLAEGSSGALPEPLRAAAPFSARPGRPHPWPEMGHALMYVAPAPAPAGALPAPAITRDGKRLSLELQAPADLWALGVRHQGQERILTARWQGRELTLRDDDAGQRVLLVLGQERNVELELELDREPAELPHVLAIALGLPQAAGPLQQARGTSAVASGFGDMTMLHLTPEVR